MAFKVQLLSDNKDDNELSIKQNGKQERPLILSSFCSILLYDKKRKDEDSVKFIHHFV